MRFGWWFCARRCNVLAERFLCCCWSKPLWSVRIETCNVHFLEVLHASTINPVWTNMTHRIVIDKAQIVHLACISFNCLHRTGSGIRSSTVCPARTNLVRHRGQIRTEVFRAHSRFIWNIPIMHYLLDIPNNDNTPNTSQVDSCCYWCYLTTDVVVAQAALLWSNRWDSTRPAQQLFFVTMWLQHSKASNQPLLLSAAVVGVSMYSNVDISAKKRTKITFIIIVMLSSCTCYTFCDNIYMVNFTHTWYLGQCFLSSLLMIVLFDASLLLWHGTT